MLPGGDRETRWGDAGFSEQERRFTAACVEHSPSLRRFLRSRWASVDDIEDVIQETFSVAWAKRELIQEGKMRGFLIRTAHQILLGHARKERRQQRLAEVHSETIVQQVFGSRAHTNEPHAVPAGKDETARLATLLGRLTPRQAEAVRLTYLDGLTQREAAARLGVTQQAVAKAVQAGVEHIRTAETHPAS